MTKLKNSGRFNRLSRLNFLEWWSWRTDLHPALRERFENHKDFSGYWKNAAFKDDPKARAKIRSAIKKQIKQAFRSIAPKISTWEKTVAWFKMKKQKPSPSRKKALNRKDLIRLGIIQELPYQKQYASAISHLAIGKLLKGIEQRRIAKDDYCLRELEAITIEALGVFTKLLTSNDEKPQSDLFMRWCVASAFSVMEYFKVQQSGYRHPVFRKLAEKLAPGPEFYLLTMTVRGKQKIIALLRLGENARLISSKSNGRGKQWKSALL